MQRLLANYGRAKLRKSGNAMDVRAKMVRATSNGIPNSAMYARLNSHSGRLASKPAFGLP